MNTFGKPPVCELYVKNCSLCSLVFPSKIDRDLHLIEVHSVVPCDMCDHFFITVQNYKVHFIDCHTTKCRICNIKLLDERQFWEHMQYAHNFKCCKCTRVFDTIGLRNQHYKANHVEVKKHDDLIKCDECTNKTVLSGLKEYRQHYEKVHATNTKNANYKRPRSVSNFTSSAESIKPYKSSNPNQQESNSQFECVVCKEILKTAANRKDHYQFIHDFKICAICQELFQNDVTNEEHFKLVHCNFKCSFCSDVYLTKELLEGHVRVRHELKCELCQKLFSTETMLQNHYTYGHVTIDLTDDVKNEIKEEGLSDCE